jgi:malate dehydrogenase (oxaloacetate-decarboxylating)(NADP+)
MNQWKSAHAVETDRRTLEEAMVGADVFLGVSVKGAVTPEMVASMAPDPVIFAMANPDPEITPEEAHEVRPDAIVATGRSDYPNQVNNVLGFPYLFRGALDIHARAINDEMKIACAKALAELAREDVPDEVAVAYGKKLTFGRDYIIPTPFDPRLIYTIPPAVAKAGSDSAAWRGGRSSTWSATPRASRAGSTRPTRSSARSTPRRAAPGDDDLRRGRRSACAARRRRLPAEQFRQGHRDRARRRRETEARSRRAGRCRAELEVMNAAKTEHLETYKAFLYERLQRRAMTSTTSTGWRPATGTCFRP